MAWQPEPEPLRQLAGYLKDTLSGHDKQAQGNATLVSVIFEHQTLEVFPDRCDLFHVFFGILSVFAIQPCWTGG